MDDWGLSHEKRGIATLAYSEEELAVGLLSTLEQERYSRLKQEKQRRDFLRGRRAARLAFSNTFSNLDINHVSILNSEKSENRGQPILFYEGKCLGFISISHQQGVAVAAYSPDAPVGVDIDAVEPKDESFAETWFTKEELDFVDFDISTRALRESIVWSAKEAMSKVLGVGLSASTHELMSHPVDTVASEFEWSGTYRGRKFRLKTTVSAHVVTIAL